MVSRTSARWSASHARIGAYASKIGFQIGSFSRRRSLANPIVGVCDVAIAPMILAMIAVLMGVRAENIRYRGDRAAQFATMFYSACMSTLPSRRDIIRLIGASAAAAFVP